MKHESTPDCRRITIPPSVKAAQASTLAAQSTWRPLPRARKSIGTTAPTGVSRHSGWNCGLGPAEPLHYSDHRGPVTSGEETQVTHSTNRHAIPHIPPSVAVRALETYNRGSYRGQLNVEVDRRAYERFRHGLSTEPDELADQLCFVAREYGGAQRRFLPHDYPDEARLVVERLRPDLGRWTTIVSSARPLADAIPEAETLAFLFDRFAGSKRWPVWTSKTLHFLIPDAFPILDSRVKRALGRGSMGSTPRDYHRFCGLIRETLLANREAIAAARAVAGTLAPSDVKLLDNILFQMADECIGV